MIRNYKRQTTRGSYGDDRLARALDAVKAGDSVNKASGRLDIESRSCNWPVILVVYMYIHVLTIKERERIDVPCYYTTV